MIAIDSSAAVRSAVEGEIAGARPDVITFSKGLPGFEACHAFVVMASDDDLQYLSSVEGPSASFLVIDPRRIQPGYRCLLSHADRHSLGAEEMETDSLLWLALVMLEQDGAVTVNLRAPVVINPIRMVGQQVIPYHCIYPLRHVLIEAV